MTEWSADKLVWPWCMDRFAGTKGDKLSVTENLSARRFPLKKLAEAPPEQRVQDAASTILQRMLNAKEEGKLPWLLILSNAPVMLQALANLIPVGYSLSTLGSCAVTSTAKLMDLFFSKKPMDMFEPDPDGELLHEIQISGFLSWEGINGTVSGSPHQYGRFSALMDYRLQHRLLTLMTAPYVMWSNDTLVQTRQQIGLTAGTSVAAMLMEVPTVNLKVTLPKVATATMEI